MKRPGLIIIFLVLVINHSTAQTLLDADGTSDTYDLINSVLAPGHDVIEAPGTTVGACDNHSAFGRHITQVIDEFLGIYVFAFHIHVVEDNDRCINFDRQRNEIKTYDQSPVNLLGVLGETVEYKWKFRLDDKFQPSSSFTHIHQLKSVGSPEDVMPLITLTPRKGTPDKLELRFAANTTQSTIYAVDLDPFKGTWVEVSELVTYGEAGYGRYAISIETIQDGTNLMSYSSDALRMWKTDADFIRPKWGIYRSLNDAASLRDEIVYFANFSIYEKEDVIAPRVKISTPANELNTLTFNITIQFSEEVNGFTETDLVVTNGSVLAGSLRSSDNVSFSATIVPAFTGDVKVYLPVDAVQDAAGNGNEASEQLTVPEDTTAPTVSIELSKNETTPVLSAFGIDISFSEPVMGFDETDIQVENGLVHTGSLTGADQKDFTATIIPAATSPADININIHAGAARDVAGNDNEAAVELQVPFTVISSVEEPEAGGISVFPNPVVSVLNIQMNEWHEEFTVSLIEQSGRVIFTGYYSGKDIDLDLSDYENGVYILRVKTREEVYYQKIIFR